MSNDFNRAGKSQEGAKAIIDAEGLIEHVHVAEQEGRGTPGVNGEDFKPYLAALKKIDYRGAVTIEAKWKPENLEAGFTTLRQQWEEA
ncbi:MAG: hypothetical protein AAGD43_06495 [Pseudomonadota bacterium]